MIRYYFKTRNEAEDERARVIDIARNRRYQYATTGDFNDNFYDNFYGSKLGWTLDTLCQATIVRCVAGYAIELPSPVPVKNLTSIGNESTNTEPVFITIHSNELDVYDPDEIISSVIKHANEIKDRMVNITIM